MRRLLWLLAGCAALVAAVLLTLRASPQAAYDDALQARVLGELDAFVSWLERHDVPGYVGEVGWPAGEGYDTARWNALGDRWLQRAQEAGLWITVWGAGAWWGTDYPLSPFVASDAEAIDRTAPQGAVIARHTGGPPLGVNVSGGEFGAPGGVVTESDFSNAFPGQPGVDYAYDVKASYEYLAGQGIDHVRLAFRWERIQPALFQPLDEGELSRLRAAVDDASAAGLCVVLNVHNYGGYLASDAEGRGVRQPVGSPEVPGAALADLWQRLSEAFAGHHGVTAYGLMNEPHSLAADADSSARRWEVISQQALDAIRATGDTTLVMVPGAGWSSVRGWGDRHPQPWIEDEAGRFRYQAHHYFDADHSGRYTDDYAAEVGRARARR